MNIGFNYTARKQVCKSMRVQYGGITDTKQILLRKLVKCQYRMGITNNLAEISEDFYVYGLKFQRKSVIS